MAATVLRPYQAKLLERWAVMAQPRRLFLAWDMGAGKTLASLKVAESEGAQRILVICPALVRAQWVREAKTHLPHLTAAAIETGCSVRLSKAQNERRAQALEANVQVTSYDLLHTIPRLDWEFIIIDEFHALRSPSSKQSQNVRAIFTANPKTSALGLSGTPIPNEAKQLWNPVDTFFPGRWGRQHRKGYVPYRFCSHYCYREENEFGVKYSGLREERRTELASRFAQISDRVVQADFANYLPPLYVEPLEVGAKVNGCTLARQWLETLGEDVAHIGIYCHLRTTAHALYKHFLGLPGFEVTRLTGELTADERDAELTELRDSPRSLVIGTTHALQEGVSLSFQKAALILEWTSDVGGVVQFLGRFSRQDSTSLAPTRIHVAIGPNDVSAAETISKRVQDINHVMRASRATEVAAKAFAPLEMSDDAFFAQLQSIAVQHETRTKLWSSEDDDDVDEE